MLQLRHPVSLLVIALLVMAGVLRSYSTPSPVGGDAPDVIFSAIRAEAILGDLLQENLPHVSGSPYNTVVRNRIVAHLESSGYQPQFQTRFHCNPMFGSCSPVENIIIVKPGLEGKNAVLLTAHYDSGWTGPGAADDGAGTAAILEIARMAADFPPFENDVIFLLSDSEENGLIGADAFARHHALFKQVKAVINLEARGNSGPSVLFETGDGNRSVIRMFAKSVERPVGNSLAYEIYRRMPNDTDYTVYKRAGAMGVNFAFAEGVPVYHSAIDDPAHLDLGSMQHHGDNAWSMLKAFAERDLTKITSREDAGYIDIFGSKLVHYPISITGGLALFLGVWVMLAIGLAFRKEFRFRQLRWGLLAVPFLLGGFVLGGYLLSWPLGRWPDLHPLEHPYPWAGRLAVFLMLGLVGYTTLKVFSGRVSACAWMIIGWAAIFVLGLVLTNKLPAASHIATLPLALFALGSVIDLFRKKSPAPLLVASILGFASAAFISFYHFFMLDVVMNFDRSHVKVAAFGLMGLAVMPMLLAFCKKLDLTWRPAKWLAAAILVMCAVHLSLPGFTATSPRDMTLMYSEVEGEDKGYIVLESIYQRHDEKYARGHAFELAEIKSGQLDNKVLRPVREVAPLGLTGVSIENQDISQEDGGWRRTFTVVPPANSPLLRLSFPKSAGIVRAWVNGELALDNEIETKHQRKVDRLQLVYPGAEPLKVELFSEATADFSMSAVTWHKLPDVLVAPFMGNWPDEARPFLYGPRAEKIQAFEFQAAETLSGGVGGS
ncbi:MAG: M28 family peptidase [Xanthomonadales bacterium]|nr:M28 family peptidase [Gammaproteobacteria bacterium]MBT8053225.1 M28 family peptidase [Gammaproteobacteria bacterium]NND57201.1 M28 family peptidase [Xanthomonadales bacterium]NNK50265.1 M28 family peptidase [Xanthomonadales bacterium]